VPNYCPKFRLSVYFQRKGRRAIFEKNRRFPPWPRRKKAMRFLPLAALGLAAALAAPVFAQDNGESISQMLNKERTAAPKKKVHTPKPPADPIQHPTAKTILGKWFVDSYTPIYMDVRPDGKLVSGWLANGKWKARAPVAYKFKDETHYTVTSIHCGYEIFKLNDTELDLQCGQVLQTFLRAVPPAGVNAPFEKPPAK
jgi:hypothetical protein